jgi:hypothetical protein
LQSPADRGAALPVASIHVNLPPHSKAKVVVNLLGLTGS